MSAAFEFEAYAARVRAATETRTPLRIRGGGSKDFYGGPLQGELLDTRSHSGIVGYEPSELVITARAGTPLGEIESVLATRRQCIACEPPQFGTAALGGESTNPAVSDDGRFVEVQGTAEGDPFPRAGLDRLMDLAMSGIEGLLAGQARALGER